MHVYAFGSLCRGELTFGSDIDLLAVLENVDTPLDPNLFSIYSLNRLRELWSEGNPFAWHLASEAKLIYAGNHRDIIAELGKPAIYKNCKQDCLKFTTVYLRAMDALNNGSCSRVFELSAIFLALRNFATCFSLGVFGELNFSRHSARKLGMYSVKISQRTYNLLERARILGTRAIGPMIQKPELTECLEEVKQIGSWMDELLKVISDHGRIQQ